MLLPFNTTVWFYRHPVDFRCQIDGLVLLVADKLKLDPTSGQLFVFRNRQADKIRLLFWDDDGFWLLYKRKEQTKFLFPSIVDDSMTLSMQQLQWLLSGLDITRYKVPEKSHFTRFF